MSTPVRSRATRPSSSSSPTGWAEIAARVGAMLARKCGLAEHARGHSAIAPGGRGHSPPGRGAPLAGRNRARWHSDATRPCSVPASGHRSARSGLFDDALGRIASRCRRPSWPARTHPLACAPLSPWSCRGARVKAGLPRAASRVPPRARRARQGGRGEGFASRAHMTRPCTGHRACRAPGVAYERPEGHHCSLGCSSTPLGVPGPWRRVRGPTVLQCRRRWTLPWEVQAARGAAPAWGQRAIVAQEARPEPAPWRAAAPSEACEAGARRLASRSFGRIATSGSRSSPRSLRRRP